MKSPFYIRTVNHENKRWRFAGIILVLVSLTFTLGFWYILEDSNASLATSRLAADKEIVLDTLEKRLEVYSDVLYGGRALFLINPELQRDDWDTYMVSQNLFERYPGLNTVAYVEATDRAGADGVIADINNQLRVGEPPAVLYPNIPTEKYAVVKYTTFVGETRLAGLNAYAREQFVEMLDRAAVAAVPVASEPYMSPNPDRVNTMDFAVALAVYDRTFRNDMNAAERREALTGYIVATLHPATIFEQGVAALSNRSTVEVAVNTVDGTSVYSYGSQLNGQTIGQRTAIDVAGNTWYVNLSAPAAYDLTSRQVYAPLFFLVAGFVFMLLIVNLFFYWTGVRFTRSRPTPKQSK